MKSKQTTSLPLKIGSNSQRKWSSSFTAAFRCNGWYPPVFQHSFGKFVFPIGKGKLSSQLCQLREITGVHKSFCRGEFKEGTPELIMMNYDGFLQCDVSASESMAAACCKSAPIASHWLHSDLLASVGIFGVICCSTAIKWVYKLNRSTVISDNFYHMGNNLIPQPVFLRFPTRFWKRFWSSALVLLRAVW